MYLKKTELEQALRENMQSTLESYGGDSIAEDAICFCYDSMLAVIKQLGKDKREIMSEEELVLLLCIVQDDTRHVCEHCGTKYKDKNECKKCESNHRAALEIHDMRFHACKDSDNYPDKVELKMADGKMIWYHR